MIPDNLFLRPSGGQHAPCAIAEIATVGAQGCTVKFADGVETSKQYKRLNTYSPAAGDRVLMAYISGSYIILGRIV